jgi:ATP phosphoribosyltransferase regulatory subunit HisZ
MKIEYTFHVAERLKERGISKEEMISAIRFGTQEDGYDGAIKAVWHRKDAGPLVVVYHIKGLLEFRIITAYYRE